MYNAIGKEEYNKLPVMFSNKELAEQLNEDTEWCGWTYMLQHKSRKDNNGPIMGCVNMKIKFTKNDRTFKKVYCPVNTDNYKEI